MTLITKPSTINRGNAYTFTLDKDELALLEPIASSAYYSNQSNWKSCSILYKSTTRNQYELVRFGDMQLASPEGEFEVSSRSQGNFEIQSILINDFDGGRSIITRDDLGPGDNLISNGTFDTGLTDWIQALSGASKLATWESGEMKADSTGSQVSLMKQLGLMTAGIDYTLSFDVRRTVGSGFFNVEIDVSDSNTGNTEILNLYSQTGKNGSTQISSDGSYETTFTAPASSDSIMFGNQSTANVQTIYYDNIELRTASLTNDLDVTIS